MNIDEIFDTYYDRVYAFTLCRVRHVQSAEDITSEVFLRVVKNYGRYDERKASVSTWLFTIVLNEIRRYFQKHKDDLPLEHAEEISVPDDALESALSNERTRVLYDALSQLNEQQRSVVLLRYYGGLSNQETAVALELKETNVETILYRAKKNLIKFLEKCEVFEFLGYKNIEGQIGTDKETDNA